VLDGIREELELGMSDDEEVVNSIEDETDEVDGSADEEETKLVVDSTLLEEDSKDRLELDVAMLLDADGSTVEDTELGARLEDGTKVLELDDSAVEGKIWLVLVGSILYSELATTDEVVRRLLVGDASMEDDDSEDEEIAWLVLDGITLLSKDCDVGLTLDEDDGSWDVEDGNRLVVEDSTAVETPDVERALEEADGSTEVKIWLVVDNPTVLETSDVEPALEDVEGSAEEVKTWLVVVDSTLVEGTEETALLEPVDSTLLETSDEERTLVERVGSAEEEITTLVIDVGTGLVVDSDICKLLNAGAEVLMEICDASELPTTEVVDVSTVLEGIELLNSRLLLVCDSNFDVVRSVDEGCTLLEVIGTIELRMLVETDSAVLEEEA
jgi:hypothetical protein